jgi:hypothetical protein
MTPQLTTIAAVQHRADLHATAASRRTARELRAVAVYVAYEQARPHAR